jgi:hypothetical protein
LTTLDTAIVNKFKILDEIPKKEPETDTIQEFVKKTKGGKSKGKRGK